MLDNTLTGHKGRYPTVEEMEEYFKEILKHKDIVHYTLSFDSVMKDVDDLTSGNKRLLETSNPVVLPVAAPIKILVTSADVLHS
jgi:heme/copper-type cytochrome/quinol oxidase subunit 2